MSNDPMSDPKPITPEEIAEARRLDAEAHRDPGRGMAAFIALARSLLPRLLDEVERLREHERTCVETASDEEIDRQLREAGIDPVDASERAMTLVDGVLKWRGIAEAAERERDEAREEVNLFAREIVRAHNHRVQEQAPWPVIHDHACAACVQGGEIVVSGFRCVYHQAFDRVAAAEPAKDGG